MAPEDEQQLLPRNNVHKISTRASWSFLIEGDISGNAPITEAEPVEKLLVYLP